MFFDQRGFSLIEMMIVAAVISILAFGISSLLTESFKNQSKIEQKDALRFFQQEVESIIKYNANCGISNIPTTVTNFNDSTTYSISSITSPNSSISAGIQYGAVTISTLELTGHLNRTDQTLHYIGLDSGSTTTDKHIQANIKISAQSKALPFSSIHLPVRLTLNDTRTQIIGCQHLLAASTNMDIGLICSSMGGDWDPSTEKCQLPCPSGFYMDEKSSRCVADEDDSDSEEVFHCAMSTDCDPQTRFLGTQYD